MENEGQVTLKQVMETVEKLEDAVGDLTAAVQELVNESSTRKKLSEAGRRSAEVRREKFGSARPTTETPKPVLQVITNPVQNTLPTEHLPEPVQSKRAPKGESPGALVWVAYSAAYRNRYKVDPVRNAQVNAQCAQLAKAVGVESAVNLVAYFLTRNDMFYVRSCHKLGLCVVDVQKLITERTNGNVITMTDARRIESGSATDRAITQYAAQQNPEQVREAVHTAEVLQ